MNQFFICRPDRLMAQLACMFLLPPDPQSASPWTTTSTSSRRRRRTPIRSRRRRRARTPRATPPERRSPGRPPPPRAPRRAVRRRRPPPRPRPRRPPAPSTATASSPAALDPTSRSSTSPRAPPPLPPDVPLPPHPTALLRAALFGPDTPDRLASSAGASSSSAASPVGSPAGGNIFRFKAEVPRNAKRALFAGGDDQDLLFPDIFTPKGSGPRKIPRSPYKVGRLLPISWFLLDLLSWCGEFLFIFFFRRQRFHLSS